MVSSTAESAESTLTFIDPITDPRWDAWARSAQDATVFHLSPWARVLRDCYGFTPLYVSAETGSHARSLLPFMEVSSWLTGRRGISLPFSDMCPQLGATDRISRGVFQALIDRGIERHWRYVETRAATPDWPDARPASSYYAHILDASSGQSAVFSKFDSAVRRNVRKAEKSGLTAHICSDLASVREHFRLHAYTRKRHGLPPQPFHFFEAIQRHVLAPGLGYIAAVRQNGRTLASVVFFKAGPVAFFKFGASDERHQLLRPANLALWTAIRHSIDLGATTVHFGRNALNHDSLRRFKLSWGTTESRIDYYRYDLKDRAFNVEPNLLSGWQNHVFSALPLGLSRLLGRMLYRHIA